MRRKVIIVNGKTDEERLQTIHKLAKRPNKNGKKSLVCVEVKSQQLLRRLQTETVSDDAAERLEIHPYSFEELWAQRLFVSLPQRRIVLSPLDWTPITYDSERRVNLVVFGLNAMSEALVKQACLVCHFPNYIRDKNRKTCITVVDAGLKEDDNLFLNRFRLLLNNCQWSFVDKDGNVSEHKPNCDYLGGEFVDVEFKFVAAEAGSEMTRGMLAELAKSVSELPTIVFAGEDGEKNWDLATTLPAEFYVENCHIPIYVRIKDASTLGSAALKPQYRNIMSFGMDDCEFDLSLPLRELGKGMAFLYDKCYNNGGVVCDEIDDARAEEIWKGTSALNRFSNEVNAMNIMTKLRSTGKDENAMLTDGEVAMLSEVEHNRWSVEKLIAGMRPVTEDEQRAIDADRSVKERCKALGAHYDLRPYAVLTEDSTGNNVQLYDAVLVRGMQAVVRNFKRRDKGASMVVVQRNKGEKGPSKGRRVAKWSMIAVFALLVLGVLTQVVVHLSVGLLAEYSVAEYVYRLRVDSVVVWNGNGSVDTVLYTGEDSIVGTAFSLEGVGIVTARHCVEYWLYENPTEDTDEKRLAIDVETFNDTTSGVKKRMVSFCSLWKANGDFYESVSFKVDQSHDKVMPIDIDDRKWRYVLPVFRGDRKMLTTDWAVCFRKDEEGIPVYKNFLQKNRKACALGYPVSEGLGLYNPEVTINVRPSGMISMSGEVSPGMSGGPVVVLDKGQFKVVGVISHDDLSGAKFAWATPLHFIRRL